MTLHVDIAARAGSFEVSCAFAVERGDAVALIGASGAGKTTVLRTIAGLLRPHGGRVGLGDEIWFDAESRRELPPQRRDCTMVFADGALFGHMTVHENVAFGLRAGGGSRHTVDERVRQALALVGVGELDSRKAASLSSGEAQRVAIARALAPGPRVLLLDEPLSNIDVERRPPVRTALSEAITRQGIATVLVTHDPVEAMLFSDHLIVLEAGAVVQQGSPADLRERPGTSYVAAFVGVNLYRGKAAPLDQNLSAVDVAGTTILIPGRVSGPVALVVDPDAVVLSRAWAPSSARNSLRGVVAGIVPDGASLRVSLHSAPPIVARVTRTAADELELAAGVEVFASFKASEVRVH